MPIERTRTFADGQVITAAWMNNDPVKLFNLLGGLDEDHALFLRAVAVPSGDDEEDVAAVIQGQIQLVGNGIVPVILIYKDGDDFDTVGPRIRIHNNGNIRTVASQGSDDTSAQLMYLDGVIHSNGEAVANVGAGEDGLHSLSIGDFILANPGSVVQITAFGKFAANVTAKALKMKVAGVTVCNTGVIDSGSAGDWRMDAEIITNEVPDSLYVSVNLKTSSGSPDPVNNVTNTVVAFADPTSSIAIAFTGEGAADDDVTQLCTVVRKGWGGQTA